MMNAATKTPETDIAEVPVEFLEALVGKSVSELEEIERDIEMFETTGMLRPRTLGLIKRLCGNEDGARKRERIELII